MYYNLMIHNIYNMDILNISIYLSVFFSNCTGIGNDISIYILFI